MKKDLLEQIEIPEGVEVKIDSDIITVKGPEGENKKNIHVNKINFEIKDNNIIISSKLATKTEKKMMNTMISHLRNMILGVQNKFEYQLKICFSHFPITVDLQGKEATIKNFLGEKIPRKVKIHQDVEVKIDGQMITITSINKESAGQAAANFEKATKIKKRDKRVFQDGIFMTIKAGREI
ncbi:50S ribosomal protein L6 [Candidatus Pacearchaeota archaeon]|nr:50S ribosomal protein L6 [Candidatus Pacearchaeota archaeon]